MNLLLPMVLSAVLAVGGAAPVGDPARDRAGTLTGGADTVPPPLRSIEIEERLGRQVLLDLPFADQEGKPVSLRHYLKPGRPLILTLNYYECPTLCSFLLNSLVTGMKGLDFTVGKEFQVVTVSIDHREGPSLALAKRKSYLQALGKQNAAGDWPFLTGTKDNVQLLADAVGFHFRFDAASNQYAHAAGIFVLTPDGRISRVLYGLEYPSRDLRLSLVEASRGAIGTPVDRLLLFCFHYDPQARKYGLTPMGVMRIGGLLMVVALGIFLLTLWRRERRASVAS